MVYDLEKISMTTLMRPAFYAGIAPTRFDERIARSPVGAGWIERQNFADACASQWIDCELLYFEDLVLHDAKDVINDNDQPDLTNHVRPCWELTRRFGTGELDLDTQFQNGLN